MIKNEDLCGKNVYCETEEEFKRVQEIAFKLGRHWKRGEDFCIKEKTPIYINFHDWNEESFESIFMGICYSPRVIGFIPKKDEDLLDKNSIISATNLFTQIEEEGIEEVKIEEDILNKKNVYCYDERQCKAIQEFASTLGYTWPGEKEFEEWLPETPVYMSFCHKEMGWGKNTSHPVFPEVIPFPEEAKEFLK